MIKFTLIFILCLTYINASTDNAELPYNERIDLLHSIERYGIQYGKGEHNVYVFVDPLCPYSRKFISMISAKQKMLSKYRYTIYLYEIPRLHSSDTIAAIYKSKEPLNTLLDIMLKDKKASTSTTQNIQMKTEAISTVAQKLHVKKRPFLVIEN